MQGSTSALAVGCKRKRSDEPNDQQNQRQKTTSPDNTNVGKNVYNSSYEVQVPNFYTSETMSAIRSGDLEVLRTILARPDTDDALRIQIMQELKPAMNLLRSGMTHKFALDVLKLLIPRDDAKQNEWLIEVRCMFGKDNAALLVARYADLATMQRVLATNATFIYSINTVLQTALDHNQNISTIEYLIGVLLASKPDSVPLRMYAALTDKELIQGETLKEFLLLLRHPLQQEDIRALFQVSTIFTQHLVLRSLFGQCFEPPMTNLVHRVCHLDNVLLMQVMVDVCEDAHMSMLLHAAVKTDLSNKTLSIVVCNYFSRPIVYSRRRVDDIVGFLKQASKRNNLDAWILMLEKYPKQWGALRGVLKSALSAPSSDYIKVLYSSGHFPFDNADEDNVSSLKQAAANGCSATVLWVIETLKPPIPPELLGYTLANKKQRFGLASFYLQREHFLCSIKFLFRYMIMHKRLGDIEFMYLTMNATCTESDYNGHEGPDQPTLVQSESVHVLLSLLKRLCTQEQIDSPGLVHVNEDESALRKAVWEYMVNSEEVLRDGLPRDLPRDVRGLIDGYHRSPHSALEFIQSTLPSEIAKKMKEETLVPTQRSWGLREP
jgi:hypothetical protein